jgi:hypothetical protein
VAECALGLMAEHLANLLAGRETVPVVNGIRPAPGPAF